MLDLFLLDQYYDCMLDLFLLDQYYDCMLDLFLWDQCYDCMLDLFLLDQYYDCILDVTVLSHQYYATVDPGSDLEEDCYPWLPQENVEDRFEEDLSGLPEMVSSGHSVGGVVYSTIPGTKVKNKAAQWVGGGRMGVQYHTQYVGVGCRWS